YLDGDRRPVLDLPFQEYFTAVNFPLVFPSLVYESARGWNSYVPIPYQKSCKIVADKDYGQFFHFTYSTFPKGTRVPTFKRELTVEEASALARAEKMLSHRGGDPAGERPGQRVVEKTVEVAPGRAVSVLELAGAGAITSIRVHLDLPEAPDDRKVLRELALSLRWDGESEPSVWAPLGDFFGTAPGANPYRSLPMGLGEDGWWYSHWYMPFAERAKLELTNDGRASHEVTFQITFAALSKPVERLARFHAKWHRDAFLPEDPNRWIDWPMLKTRGQGRFCGVMLHVWNPNGGWWGEGDEKFFVDGEKFPSIFGTGSEDYFGYAWCDPTLFDRAYHNQTLCENANAGHVSVNRWQITDNVPFQTSFEGCIEKYFPNDRPTLYACTAYWYLAPGGDDPYRPVTDVWERLGYVVTDVEAPTTAERMFVQEGEIILETATEGAEIRYTLDGTEPTLDSLLYREPIPLSETTTIQARAFKEECYPSRVATFEIVRAEEYRRPDQPDEVVPGLNYEYYQGQWEKLPDFDALQPAHSGTAEVFGVTPALALDEDRDDFGLRFRGYLWVEQDGIYEFFTQSDDGSQLFIGEQMVVDNDGLHGVEERSGQIALGAGLHAVTLTFFERGGVEFVEVLYQAKDIEKQPIPARALFRAP
ncbi:MAG TPA: DUF2961 domain-containing protein, partial [Firmicutes bacterium]|nr:DUF2961 domain-containing protein [Bacillota bacterium]